MQVYLALCFAIHTVLAVYQTLKKKAFRGATSEPLSVLRRLYLLLSGAVILAFVVAHLSHFKFGERLDYVRPPPAAAGGGNGNKADAADAAAAADAPAEHAMVRMQQFFFAAACPAFL